mgnify:CR=1 FL=1
MPTKAKKSSSKKSPIIEDNSFLSKIKWDDSYVSLVVGLLVVVVIAVLGVVFFKGNRTMQQDTSSAQFKPSIEFNQKEEKEEVMDEQDAIKEEAVMQEEAKAPVAEVKVEAGSTYTVKAGDTLWSISERTYKSGYNWVDIAKANKLSNPGTIFTGTKLSMPEVKAKDVIVAVKPDTQMQAKSISGNSYTIQKGDDLWNISVRAYGDGYSWLKIAKANNLIHPDLIFSGNVLKIPR